MGKKVGRPTIPKRDAKTQMRGAFFTPDDARAVDEAIAESGQDKSKWIREKLLWGLHRENVWSTKWKAKDLDKKSVSFKLMETPNRCILGKGQFLAIQRGDGSMDVRIFTRDKNDPDPQGYNDIPVTQRGIDLLEKSPAGSECEFSLIDPLAP
jgi:hypothetical protein